MKSGFDYNSMLYAPPAATVQFVQTIYNYTEGANFMLCVMLSSTGTTDELAKELIVHFSLDTSTGTAGGTIYVVYTTF